MYAVNGNSWRAINSISDLLEGETFSEVAPPAMPDIVPDFVEFSIPVKAPDFFVASPKPKKNPKEAFAEALGEARKPHGVSKSIALIVVDLMEYIDDLEKRVDKLEKK